ncbi:KH domain-containing protein [Thermogladius sp. 4427co]|uniref:KH domain-containing protein n=1 Tax=Thermogladius sp. 4427co TaxID=3450718 RepID=UPI003F7ACA51
MSGEEKGRITIGVTKLYENIPLERIGVLIGGEGKVKREIEERTRTRITIDSTSGSIIIEPAFPSTTMFELMKARDIVKAIGLGFSPEKAMRLLGEDQILIVIELKQYVGDKPNHLRRVLGRIIGEEGKARRIIEEMTGTYISVYDTYVSIIGDYETANIAKTAIEMLIEGRMHSTVYSFIEREMEKLKRRRMTELWRPREL